MPYQPNLAARPNVATALAAIEAVVRPAIRDLYGPHSCIGTVRAGLDVLRRLGVAARPVAVEVSIFNAAFVARARELDRFPLDREEGERWFEEVGAHSIAITGMNEPPERRWAGHLCLLLEDQLLVDPSLDQVARPQYGIVPPDLMTLDAGLAFQQGRERIGGHHAGTDFIYRCHPADRGYERGQWFNRPVTRRVVRDALKWARRGVAVAA